MSDARLLGAKALHGRAIADLDRTRPAVPSVPTRPTVKIRDIARPNNCVRFKSIAIGIWDLGAKAGGSSLRPLRIPRS
jgi:hypothetical protein